MKAREEQGGGSRRHQLRATSTMDRDGARAEDAIAMLKGWSPKKETRGPEPEPEPAAQVDDIMEPTDDGAREINRSSTRSPKEETPLMVDSSDDPDDPPCLPCWQKSKKKEGYHKLHEERPAPGGPDSEVRPKTKDAPREAEKLATQIASLRAANRMGRSQISNEKYDNLVKNFREKEPDEHSLRAREATPFVRTLQVGRGEVSAAVDFDSGQKLAVLTAVDGLKGAAKVSTLIRSCQFLTIYVLFNPDRSNFYICGAGNSSLGSCDRQVVADPG